MVNTFYSNGNHSFLQTIVVTQSNKIKNLNSIYTYMQILSQNLQKRGPTSSNKQQFNLSQPHSPIAPP
jgi:hypothetical protein